MCVFTLFFITAYKYVLFIGFQCSALSFSSTQCVCDPSKENLFLSPNIIELNANSRSLVFFLFLHWFGKWFVLISNKILWFLVFDMILLSRCSISCWLYFSLFICSVLFSESVLINVMHILYLLLHSIVRFKLSNNFIEEEQNNQMHQLFLRLFSFFFSFNSTTWKFNKFICVNH